MKCSESKRAYSRAYYAKNKALCLAMIADWKRRNKARILEGDRRRYAQNPSKFIAKYSARRAKNLAKYKAIDKASRKKHYARVLNENHKKRVRQRNQVVGDQKVIIAWQKKWRRAASVTCYWCKKKFRGSRCVLDHILPIAKGGPHSIENVCISCPSCNGMKNAKSLEAWNEKLVQPVLL